MKVNTLHISLHHLSEHILHNLRLLVPRFIEEKPIRDDKNAQNIIDVRISQIMDLVDIPQFDVISKYDLEHLEILASKV